MKSKQTIVEAIFLEEIKRLNITVFPETFSFNDNGFSFNSTSNELNTNEIFKIEDFKFSVLEKDITSDEEREEGLEYSHYEFTLLKN